MEAVLPFTQKENAAVMEEKKKKGVGYWLLYIALPLAVLIVWEGFSLAGKLKPYALPKPVKIIETDNRVYKKRAAFYKYRRKRTARFRGLFSCLHSCFYSRYRRDDLPEI